MAQLGKRGDEQCPRTVSELSKEDITIIQEALGVIYSMPTDGADGVLASAMRKTAREALAYMEKWKPPIHHGEEMKSYKTDLSRAGAYRDRYKEAEDDLRERGALVSTEATIEFILALNGRIELQDGYVASVSIPLGTYARMATGNLHGGSREYYGSRLRRSLIWAWVKVMDEADRTSDHAGINRVLGL